MEKRYTRLYSINGPLYSNGSPVLISAGALLNDHVTGKVLSQLKFRNISLKKIKALKIEVTPKDTVGRNLGDSVVYQYLDLQIKRDEEFGQKEAIYLPDPSTRTFSVRALEAAFTDNSIWTEEDGSPWEQIEQPEEFLKNDGEMLKQYRMDINREAKQKLQLVKDLWICTCGAVNRREETKCHSCNTNFASMSNADMDELKKNCALRLEKEEAERLAAEKRLAEEQAEKERLAAEREKARLIEQKEKRKKNEKRLKAAVAAIAALTAVMLILTKAVIPNAKYASALSLMEEGEYEEAVSTFERLNGYKESDAMIEECRKRENYEEAKDYMSKQDYVSALKKLKPLGDYRDSRELIEECKPMLIEQAAQKIQGQYYSEAREILSLLKEDADCKQWIKMVDAMIAYNEKEYTRAYYLFKNVDTSFVEKNKELYEGWFSASCCMTIMSKKKLSVDDALKLYAEIPESHKDDNKEYFDSLRKLKKCAGTYVYKSDQGKSYKLELDYWLEEGKMKADVSYENFSGTFDEPGNVSLPEDDKDYDFQIHVAGRLSSRSKAFTININPEHANVKGPGAFGSNDCYRDE